jgi:hypothetical protein
MVVHYLHLHYLYMKQLLHLQEYLTIIIIILKIKKPIDMQNKYSILLIRILYMDQVKLKDLKQY